MIIDGVVHAFNFSEANLLLDPLSARFARGVYAHHLHWSPPSPSPYVLDEADMVCDFHEDATAAAVFAESPIDMAVYHSTPIFDFFKDGLSSLEKGVRLKQRYPRRVLHYGALSLLDVREALEELDRLVEEYNIDGLKFYPAVYRDGATIATSIADREVAFPVIEKARELGINNVAVHKAIPLGPTTTDPYRVDDVEAAAAAFQDVNFQIVHAGSAFTEHTAGVITRFPNVYANLEATFGMIIRSPRAFFSAIGQMAEWAGWEKLIFASGCNVAHPRPMIEKFLETPMPDDLIEDWGYPGLDEYGRGLVLGGNLARLHGLSPDDVPTDDEFAVARRNNPVPWSFIRREQGAA